MLFKIVFSVLRLSAHVDCVLIRNRISTANCVRLEFRQIVLRSLLKMYLTILCIIGKELSWKHYFCANIIKKIKFRKLGDGFMTNFKILISKTSVNGNKIIISCTKIKSWRR